jgi:hypothetical protein
MIVGMLHLDRDCIAEIARLEERWRNSEDGWEVFVYLVIIERYSRRVVSWDCWTKFNNESVVLFGGSQTGENGIIALLFIGKERGE